MGKGTRHRAKAVEGLHAQPKAAKRRLPGGEEQREGHAAEGAEAGTAAAGEDG